MTVFLFLHLENDSAALVSVLHGACKQYKITITGALGNICTKNIVLSGEGDMFLHRAFEAISLYSRKCNSQDGLNDQVTSAVDKTECV